MLNAQNDSSVNLEKDTESKVHTDLKEDDKDKSILEYNSDEKRFDKTEDKPFNQKSQKFQQIEQQTKEDILKVEMLLKAGVLNQNQGESLIQQIIKKGYAELQQYDLNTDNKANDVQNKTQEIKQFDKVEAIIEFEKDKPDFFNKDGRLEVLNYIKSGILEFDKQELELISNLIEKIEKSAVERYVKQAEYEAKLNQTNNEAKSRLSANAQNAKDRTDKQIAFTREQIGKMSSSEFNRNEKLIMEQLKQGLIR